MEDSFLGFNWDDWKGNFTKINHCHSLLSLTKRVIPFKEFLQDYVWAYPDIATFPGFESELVELPVFVFTDYDNYERIVINLLELNAFELIKYADYLFVEEKEAGTFILKGDMPEDFTGDRGTRKRWKTLSEAAGRRNVERRTTGWIPDVEIGR